MPISKRSILFKVLLGGVWVALMVLAGRLWGEAPFGDAVLPVLVVAYVLVNGHLNRMSFQDTTGPRRNRRAKRTGRSLLGLGLASLMLASVAPGHSHAQSLPGSPPSEDAKATAPSTDLFGRETPRGLANGLIAALAARDYLRASRFLEPEAVDTQTIDRKAPANADGTEQDLARSLQINLDRGGALIPFALLSNVPQGALDDGLPVDQEKLGTFKSGETEIPLLARRISLEDGGQIWVISAESLAALPVASDSQPSAITAALPEVLSKTAFAGAPIADWLVLAGLALLAFAISRVAFWLIDRGLRLVVKNRRTSRVYKISHAALPPVSLYVAVMAVYMISQSLQVAIVARQTLSQYAGLVGWFALAWFLWRLIETVGDLWSARMARRDRRRAMAMVTFARRIAKVALVAVAGIAMLDTMGLDITAGIAALGLGGLAFALGAQKTVENLVGSLAVIADQPVRVGDFCKVGDVLGTVEDVGMRSTRIRTNWRTVVSIPNGVFASMQIENYSKRDRFLFNPTLGLTYDLDAAGMRRVLAAVRTVLTTDVHINDENARARFTGFHASSLDIEIFAYVSAVDFPEFLEHQERLLLALMDAVTTAGGEFAFPTQTLMTRVQSLPEPGGDQGRE